MISGTTNWFGGVWGSSSEDVLAVGFSGTIRHYDGISWSPGNIGTFNALHSIWGNSSGDIFAVGAWGTILHYSGETPTWSPWAYDANEDGDIDKSEAIVAIIDYFGGLISKDQAVQVIILYFSS
jgi:hypothetical protein